MHGDSALDAAARAAVLPGSTLHGSANLLVCPNLDSANIAYNLLKSAAGHNRDGGRDDGFWLTERLDRKARVRQRRSEPSTFRSIGASDARENRY